MRKFVLLGLGLTLILSSCEIEVKPSTSIDLDPIYNSYMDEYFRLYPFKANFFDVDGYNDKIRMHAYPAYIDQGITLNQKYLDTIGQVDLNELSTEDQLNLRIFRYQLQMELSQFRDSVNFYSPVTSDLDSYPQQFARMATGNSVVSFKKEEDYRDFMVRMRSFREWIDQAIITMSKGLTLGKTVPRGPMENVPAQLLPFIDTPLRSHAFYTPLLELPQEMDSLSKTQLVTEYSQLIQEEVIPAYKRLYNFIMEDYLPETREEAGLVHYPDGAAQYRSLLQFYTSTEMTPEIVHQLGLKQVAGILREMDSIKKVTGFKGDLKAFFTFVKTDPSFFPFTTTQEVLHQYGSYKDTLNSLLNKMFDIQPKAGLRIIANPNFANDGAYYETPAKDGSRPGAFVVFLNDANAYNYTIMKSTFLHEAIPGHHFQLALQQEMELPDFRKYYYHDAFIEGWGLYAESLGYELGFFKDPYEYLGKLYWEMMRAVRMVVDTGIHAKGWSRAKAIDYLLEHVPAAREFAEAEIDRYIVYQGQAVSYKVGELKILELKEKAKERLGAAFNETEFHRLLLSQGALPLFILEELVNSWIDNKINDPGQTSDEMVTAN